MSPDTTIPPTPRVEIGMLLTPLAAAQQHFTAYVDVYNGISSLGRFRTYAFSSALRTIYCLTEDAIIVMLTSNVRFVQLAYTLEPH